MKRIGLLGGTFDPVHQGHIAMANFVRKKLQLDEVWFIPTLKTPLKQRTLSCFEIRVEMLKRALQPWRHLKICTIESQLEVPSYTINTVMRLRQLHPHYQFCWILGDDQYHNLDQWKSIDLLKSMIRFVVVSREGIGQREQGMDYLEYFHHPASSTAIRQGGFHYLPKSLRRFVSELGLYDEEIVAAHCEPQRATHCYSVAKLAIRLATAHHVDIRKARIAGLLHDVTKSWSQQESNKWMQLYAPQAIKTNWKIWHQFTAVAYLKQKCYLYDKQILAAIAHHTTGDHNSKLSMILYLADKLDPGRGYPVEQEIQVCLQSLKKGVQLVKAQQKEYLYKKEGIHV